MTTITVDAEPACPASTVDYSSPSNPDVHQVSRSGTLVAMRRPFDSIPASTWDELVARNPWSTPFSNWAFHRAWWDAYGGTAHEQTLVVVDPADPAAVPVGIVPLMHRHAVEATDARTHSTMRHGEGSPLTAVPPTAKVIFFGASYHADYATILAAPADLPAVSTALAAYLSGDVGEAGDPEPWQAVDLRRLRCGDPAADALLDAFQKAAPGCNWDVTSEREDVCPVVTLPAAGGFEAYLSTLEKKQRHEIRRKLRRAEACGPVQLTTSTTPLADLDDFIELHQKKWGANGLFPETSGGACSRTFFRHLFRHFGSDGPLRLTRLTIAGELVASGIYFDDGDTISYYNAGVDPAARDLSPGVVMVSGYIDLALAGGRRRLDFLRGNEPYKYEWARSTSRSSASWFRETMADGTPTGPATVDSIVRTQDGARRGPAIPCFTPGPRSALPGQGRVRVVEVLATGSNGGAQESVISLLSRLDRERYDACVVSLSPGSSVRRLQRAGIPTMVIDEADDAIAVGALAAHLARIQPEVIHNHMYRAEVVGTKAALALQVAGLPRPYVISTVHSSRVRSVADRDELRRLTPSMDRLIAVSQAIVQKIEDEDRTGAPVELIYNGVDLDRYDHQEPCCTLPEEYGMEPGSQIVGVVARLEPEKGHETLLEAWPLVLRRCPDAYLLIVGEGSRREALADRAAELRIGHRVVFTGRREDVPAVTAALDVAVLPSYREAQGLTVLEAMALSRPVVASNVGGIPEMIEDGVSGLLVPPHDPVALAGAITRLLTNHALADMVARAGHDVVQRRFCLEQMVTATEALYDEGARTVRMSDVAAG